MAEPQELFSQEENTTMADLEIKGLSKQFGGIKALSDVNLVPTVEKYMLYLVRMVQEKVH